jgi:hypothetical protein
MVCKDNVYSFCIQRSNIAKKGWTITKIDSHSYSPIIHHKNKQLHSAKYLIEHYCASIIDNRHITTAQYRYELFIFVILATQQFCGQSDLLIDFNLQLCRSPPAMSTKMTCRKYALSRLILRCRFVRENASPEISLVSSGEPICN